MPREPRNEREAHWCIERSRVERFCCDGKCSQGRQCPRFDRITVPRRVPSRLLTFVVVATVLGGSAYGILQSIPT